jgi:hypothetical protein
MNILKLRYKLSWSLTGAISLRFRKGKLWVTRGHKAAGSFFAYICKSEMDSLAAEETALIRVCLCEKSLFPFAETGFFWCWNFRKEEVKAFMDFFSLIIAGIVDYLQSNPFIGLGIALVIAYAFYRKPKLSMTIFLILVILIVVIYLISYVSSVGVTYKKELIRGDMQ